MQLAFLRQSMTGFGLALVLPIVFARMAQAQPNRGKPTITDSSGIRITETELSERTIALATKPSVTLGGLSDNPDNELSTKQPFLVPTRLSDGRIAVSDWSSIKFFSPKGAFLSMSGRQGAGPGEFRQLKQLCLLSADSLLAIDYSDNRFSLWTGSGKLVKDFSRVGALASDPCLANGALLVERARSSTNTSPTPRGFGNLAIMRRDGTESADLGYFPRDEYGVIMRTVSIFPFKDKLFVADARAFEIRGYTLDGKLQSILRVNGDGALVSDTEWQALLKRGPAPNAAVKPKFFPPYNKVRIDAVGRFWIQDYRNPRKWSVVAESGEALGVLQLPFDGPYTQLSAVGRDEVGITYRDKDGAAAISYYAITIPSANSRE